MVGGRPNAGRCSSDRGGSDCVTGLLTVEGGRLIGFARVLTDHRATALILDVIVHPDHRGHGCGDVIVSRLLDHPALQGVGSVELVCQPDLVTFYSRHGFSTNVGGSTLMRRSGDPRLVPESSVG